MRVAATVALVAALALVGCGNRSMFGSQLDHELAGVNSAVERGDVELACERLSRALPLLAEWVDGARGERAATGNQLLNQVSELMSYCSVPPPVTGSGGNLMTAWPPYYKELRRISTYKTSWLTVFTYVSMLGVAIGMYIFLRRMRRSV